MTTREEMYEWCMTCHRYWQREKRRLAEAEAKPQCGEIATRIRRSVEAARAAYLEAKRSYENVWKGGDEGWSSDRTNSGP